MSTIKTTALLLLVGSLAGCAATASKNLLSEQLETTPESERAYIVGKFTVDCRVRGDDCQQAFNSISVSFKSTVNPELTGGFGSVFGQLFDKDPVPDFINREAGEKSSYFCKPLPASDYAFYTYSFYNFAGGGSGYYLRKEDEFQLPFHLNAGDVVNVGDLKVTTVEGKNILGMSIRGPGILLLRKLNADDRAKALAKCPDSVKSKVPTDAALEKNAASTKGLVKVMAP